MKSIFLSADFFSLTYFHAEFVTFACFSVCGNIACLEFSPLFVAAKWGYISLETASPVVTPFYDTY